MASRVVRASVVLAALGVGVLGPATAAPAAGAVLALDATCTGATWAVTASVRNDEAPGTQLTVTTFAVSGAADDAFAPLRAGATVKAGTTLQGVASQLPVAVTDITVAVTVVGDMSGSSSLVRSVAVPSGCGADTTSTTVADQTSASVAAATTVPATEPDTVLPSPTTVPVVLDTTVVNTSPATSRRTSSSDTPKPSTGGRPTSATTPSSTDATALVAPPVDAEFQDHGRMVVGIPAPLVARVLLHDAEPSSPIATFDPTAPTQRVTVGAGCGVSATLIFDPTKFAVNDNSEQRTNLCPPNPSFHDFSWQVTPLVSGRLGLTMRTVFNGTYDNRSDTFIDVDAATAPQSIGNAGGTGAFGAARSSTSSNPRGSSLAVGLAVVVLAAVAGGGGFVLWRRRRRRPAATVAPAMVGRPLPPPTTAGTAGGSARPMVFLSYSRRDAADVSRIEADLEENGFETWRDIDDIAGGSAWRSAISDALERSVAVVLLVSSASSTSTNVAREIALADDAGKAIVPVLIAGDFVVHGSLRYILADTQVVDVRGAARRRGMQQLLMALNAKAVRSGLPPPVVATPAVATPAMAPAEPGSLPEPSHP